MTNVNSQSTSAKTKVVVFEHRQSDVPDFVLNGAVVERVESYKYLGFVVHATKAMTFGTSFLVAAARKAMFAMRRRSPFELVMPIFFSVLVQYLTFLTVVKQMHVVVLLGTVFP